MEGKAKMKKEAEELSKDIKKLFLIYDHVRTFSKNIDEFNESKIILIRDMKKRDLVEIFNFYKSKIYQKATKLNNKTIYFIDLMNLILSYDFIPHLTEIQLLLIYNLVNAFHKGTSQLDIEKFQKSLNIYLISAVNNYSDYFSILKNIGLIKEDNEDNTDIQFFNLCKAIQLLNTFEFNSNLSAFLLLKDSIPQYRNISFPKLDSKEDEKTYNEKIKDIALLLDVINSSLGMHIENIRYELFKKYINQEDKLKAINQVLSSLNKKTLKSLSKNNLEQNIELQIEDIKFLKNENDKGIETINKLEKEIGNYTISEENLNREVETLNERIQTLSQNLKETSKKLKEEKNKKLNFISQLEENSKNLNKIYDELKNKKKYKDICSYIIDYFICLLNDNEYNIALESTYEKVVDYVLQEIKNAKYEKYNDLLIKKGIYISDLFKLLLSHKFDFNSLVHDCNRKEKEFIKLIKESEGKKISDQFESLFNETPLLRKFCFEKDNGITRNQIQNAILKL